MKVRGDGGLCSQTVGLEGVERAMWDSVSHLPEKHRAEEVALLWKNRSSLAARFQLPNLRHPIAFQPAYSFITGHRRR